MRAVVNPGVLPERWLEERKRQGADLLDEVWNGVLHMSPSPTWPHQDLAGQIFAFLLYNWAYPRGCKAAQQVNLVPPEDADDWTKNYRVPDIVMLKPATFGIEQDEFLAGAPDALVEIRSPGDESYEKLPFYAHLGVPEVWIIHRDTKKPEIHVLQEDGSYKKHSADENGWLLSAVIGIEMKSERRGKLTLRMKGKPKSAMTIPR